MNMADVMQKGFYAEPLIDIIKKRKSVRTYTDSPLPESIKSDMDKFIAILNGPFPVRVRIELLDKACDGNSSQMRLGTYGVIQGASLFAAAAVEKNAPYNLLQLGYVFEELVLYLTSLGLGTCWLGGSFSRSGFQQAIRLADNEILPVVSPIGYAGSHKSLIDWVFKPFPNRVIRKPWPEIFFNGDLQHPLSAKDATGYSAPLEMVRLAPSASNKQPWRIIHAADNFHFYLQCAAGYDKLFPYDIQEIDMGIAMCHFALTAEEQGLAGTWIYQPLPAITAPDNLRYIITWHMS